MSGTGLDGVLPFHPEENGVSPPPPPGTGYAYTGYGAGGTPLAVSRRRTLFIINSRFNNIKLVRILSSQLGKMRMTVPSRASTCNHLQCFDGPMFLLMNEKKPTWTCPVL